MAKNFLKIIGLINIKNKNPNFTKIEEFIWKQRLMRRLSMA